jgi:hypothetical protein
MDQRQQESAGKSTKNATHAKRRNSGKNAPRDHLNQIHDAGKPLNRVAGPWRINMGIDQSDNNGRQWPPPPRSSSMHPCSLSLLVSV